ncbi:hypothetical protein TIFTF001_026960 [Ficus carica]|uniref:Uncharacterized protein n=1 Tax=Ficus carica TaxID=3494 RepID=A0AA88DN47_FICCA|nr:hypothetical protein TIFTF001_026960 [Ficus carica]
MRSFAKPPSRSEIHSRSNLPVDVRSKVRHWPDKNDNLKRGDGLLANLIFVPGRSKMLPQRKIGRVAGKRLASQPSLSFIAVLHR